MSTPYQPPTNNEDSEYYVYPIYSDYQEHTSDHQFCTDPTCPCHEDPDAIAQVNEAYQEGEVTDDEATNIVRGRTF